MIDSTEETNPISRRTDPLLPTVDQPGQLITGPDSRQISGLTSLYKSSLDKIVTDGIDSSSQSSMLFRISTVF